MAGNVGLYPDWMIERLMKSGAIKYARRSNIGPASLNLRISDCVRDITEGFDANLRVQYEITSADGAAHDLCDPLERGRLYGGELMEFLELPDAIAGECTARSAFARCDVAISGVAVGGETFDAIPRGYQGQLWSQVLPRSCALKLRAHDSVLHAFFFEQRATLSRDEVLKLHERQQIFWHKTEHRSLRIDELTVTPEGSVALTADLSEEFLGWEVRTEHDTVLNLRDHSVNIFRFYRPPRRGVPIGVSARSSRQLLLASKERVRLPLDHAGLLVFGDEALSSCFVNDSRLVQPGWGWGRSGEGCGRSIVLELREKGEAPRLITDGQPIGYVRLERLAAPAMRGYDIHDRAQFLGESRYSILPPQFRKRR